MNMKYKSTVAHRRMGLIGALLLTLVLAACSSPPPPASAQINGVTSIDRDSGYVTLSVSALGHDGSLVQAGTISQPTATVENPGFDVTPGVCGPIVHKGPLSVLVLLDRSGSMTDNDSTNERAAASKAFVDRMSSDDLATVAYFAGRETRFFYPWFSNDRALLYEAIDSATATPAGGTPLWYSIELWASAWTTDGINSEGDAYPQGNKAILVLTDGEDTGGSRPGPDDVVNAATRNGVTVYMVGLGTPGSSEVARMTTVANGTGGIYVHTPEPTALDELFVNALHASRAGGCIDLSFSPTPTAGTTMLGTLQFSVNGVRFEDEYRVDF